MKLLIQIKESRPHLCLLHAACETIDVSPVTCSEIGREMERKERTTRRRDKERHGLAGGEINGHAKGTRANHHGGRSA